MLPTTTQMHHSYSCASSSSSKATPLQTEGLGADDSALLDIKEVKKNQLKQPVAGRARLVATAAVVDVCLAAACLAGAALLTWWALRFQHPSYAQLWMVPVGLVLGCTPVVVCVALHLSPNHDTRVPVPPGKGGGAAGAPPPLLSAVVVVK